MKSDFTYRLIIVCAVGVLVCGQASGQDDATPDPPKQDETADKQEEKQDKDAPPTLDELLDLPTDEADRAAAEAAEREAAEALERELSEQAALNAFAEAVTKMKLSAELLDEKFDSGLGTQRIQEDIIAKLDQIIQNAQQNSSSQSSASSSSQQQQDPNPSQQSQQQQQQDQQSAPNDSRQGENRTEMTPPGGQEGDLNINMDENRVEWGNLPDRVRDKLMQGWNEEFSTLYERLTQEYYKRLAEEGAR